MTRSPWESESENWLTWSRTPGHDAYWYYRDAFFDEILPPPGDLTLEIGCGEGRVARDLIERGHDVVALDLVFDMLQAAREMDDTLPYLQADGARLPVQSDRFDIVVAYNSLQNVDDMEGVVAEAVRVLRSGGCLCMCLPHPTRDVGRWSSDDPDADLIISGQYFGKRPFEETMERDGLTISFKGWSYPLQDYFEAMTSAGLLIDRVREPKPTQEVADKGRTWEQDKRFPLFLFIRAVKP